MTWSFGIWVRSKWVPFIWNVPVPTFYFDVLESFPCMHIGPPIFMQHRSLYRSDFLWARCFTFLLPICTNSLVAVRIPIFSFHFVLLIHLVTPNSGNCVPATASIESTPTATARLAPLDALSASFPFSCVDISLPHALLAVTVTALQDPSNQLENSMKIQILESMRSHPESVSICWM